MPVATYTTQNTTTLTNAVKTYYDKKLLKYATYDDVHLRFGQKTTVPKGSKTYEWRRYDEIALVTNPEYYWDDTVGDTGSDTYRGGAANAGPDGDSGYRLVEGKTPNATLAITPTLVTATPGQYGGYAEGTDVVSVTAVDPILDLTTKRLATHAGHAIDRITRNALAGGGAVQYAGTATSVNTITAGMKLTFAEIVEAIQTLKTNKAEPINGAWQAVISTGTWASLIQDPDFREAIVFGGRDNMFTGELPTFMGVKFTESKDAYTQTNASSVVVHTTFIFGDDAYGTVSWATMGLESIYTPPGGQTDPLNQRWKMGWKSSHAVVILNSNWYVRILHAV